jgi:hypothetical protein
MMQRYYIILCQHLMKPILTTVLLLAANSIFAQSNSGFTYAFQVCPELSFHKNEYPFNKPYSKSTFNIGLEATIRYNLSEKIFTETGMGYISRKLNVVVVFNQAVIPPPRQSFTMELAHAKSVSLRMLEFPLNIGYSIIERKKVNIHLISGITAHYLINTYYKTGNNNYEGEYTKGYWQGVSVNLGGGVDYAVYKKISITGRLAYSIINTAKIDPYVYPRDEPLSHKYLSLAMGVRMKF